MSDICRWERSACGSVAVLARALLLVSVLSIANRALGMELGTEPPSAGLGRAPLAAAGFIRPSGAGRAGIHAGLGWRDLAWRIEGARSRKNVFSPHADLFYRVTPLLDITMSVAHAEASDRQADGRRHRLTATRMGVGVDARLPRDGAALVVPYAGAALGYWLLDASADRRSGERVRVSVDDWFGLTLQVGVAWRLSDSVEARLGVSHDWLLGKADAVVDGRPADLALSSTTVALGMGLLF